MQVLKHPSHPEDRRHFSDDKNIKPWLAMGWVLVGEPKKDESEKSAKS